MPVIGYLGVSSFEKSAGTSLLAFKRGLAETGYVEERNVMIEYRWADDVYQRLPALALELVQRRVAVLVAAGSPAALPAKVATTVIPTVFMIGSDPVELGLVASLNRPGGNLTGVSYLNVEVARRERTGEFADVEVSLLRRVNLGARDFHRIGPFRHFRLDEGCEVGRRAGPGHRAELGESGIHFRSRERRID